MPYSTISTAFRCVFSLVIATLLLVGAAQAQTTAFNYQGRLNDNNIPADGVYDFQFRLFDALTGGNQTGITQLNGVQVVNGVFNVSLDFGAAAFPGATRFLEIGLRLAGSGAFTTLTPRRTLNAVPYAVRSLTTTTADALSAACAGCVADAQIAAVAGSKITGAIPVAGLPTGSGSYIQNTTTQQANSNFNVSGNGTAGGTLSGAIVRATTQFNLGSASILRLGGGPNDLFLGLNAGSSTSSIGSNTLIGNETGQALTTGTDNTYVGWRAGRFTTTGVENTFLGVGAGEVNNIGKANVFIGRSAGRSNTTGEVNTFLGHEAGFSNTIGNVNTFVGWRSGRANTSGSDNTFLGVGAGESNTFGNVNTFVGRGAGSSNTTGINNTFLGTFSGNQNTAGMANTTVGYSANILPGINNAAAIGAFARADCSNCLVLGGVAGVNGATANLNVGIGTTAPTQILDVRSGVGNAAIQVKSTLGVATLFLNRPPTSVPNTSSSVIFQTNDVSDFAVGTQLGTAGVSNFSIFDYGINDNALTVVKSNGFVGIGTSAPVERLHVNGELRVANCVKDLDSTVIAGNCSSDFRFKRDITPFQSVLPKLAKLQPVHFYWRAAEFPDRHFGPRQSYGLIAQEVEQVLPELVAKDEQGYETVNYSKLPLLNLQAIKELKAENDALKEQNAALQKANAAIEARLAALEKLLQPTAPAKK